jgi:hypothetical protein
LKATAGDTKINRPHNDTPADEADAGEANIVLLLPFFSNQRENKMPTQTRQIDNELLAMIWEHAGMECSYWAYAFDWTALAWADRFPDKGICVDVHYDNGLKMTHKVLRRADMIKGLELMKEKFPKHYADLMNEDDDAVTADVAVQMMLFGEIVFG